MRFVPILKIQFRRSNAIVLTLIPNYRSWRSLIQDYKCTTIIVYHVFNYNYSIFLMAGYIEIRSCDVTRSIHKFRSLSLSKRKTKDVLVDRIGESRDEFRVVEFSNRPPSKQRSSVIVCPRNAFSFSADSMVTIIPRRGGESTFESWSHTRGRRWVLSRWTSPPWR